MNYRTLALRLIPQSENKTVRIVVDPLPASLDLKNNLMFEQWSMQRLARCARYRYPRLAPRTIAAYRLFLTAVIPLIVEKKRCSSVSTIAVITS